jgi:hypothetical protein
VRRPTFVTGGPFLLAGLVLALLTLIPVSAQDTGPRFGAWSTAVPLGPPIADVGDDEACPFIAKDNLNLYFRSWSQLPETGAAWSYNIFVSHRDSEDAPWGDPVSLGSVINTSRNEVCSFVTIDGHWLYFVSNRTSPAGYGNTDLYVSHRKDNKDPTGWETPKNLGPYVNTSAGENGPSIFEDEATGKVVMYFTRNVSGLNKIYQTELLDRDNPGPVTPVAELNVAGAADWHAFVRRRDGLEVIFLSNRDAGGGTANSDLYVSTRPNTAAPWSTPVRLGASVNDADLQEGRPSLSWDGTTLYFWAAREWVPWGTSGYWNMRLYQATREKITGKTK